MQPLRFDPTCYRIGKRPVYLNSGEFHYFRVPKKDWRRRMRLFKQAGGNCLATYIPWLIHEPEEGRFVFGGEDGVRDLDGFLRTACEEGLYVLARPGPYQYSELAYDGLPGWLCRDYPELRARNWEGKSFRTSSISYLHPLFLEKARAWFRRVAPRISRHTLSRGGPVAFAQLDNEMAGIHEWFGSLDYHPETMGFGRPEGRYTCFLRERYRGDLDALNRAYGTRWAAFEEAGPLKPGGEATPEAIRRRKDYLDFYLGTLAEYARTLAEWLREAGVDVPFVHNSANPNMNALFVETCAALKPDLLLGSDHYYSLGQDWPQMNPTPKYAIQAFSSLEMLRLLGFPPTVHEMPSGSASDWPPILPGDARACYWLNLAYGMKGHNYYIYTGGPNVPGTGMGDEIYDYGAPVGANNEIRPLYRVQKEFGRFLAARPWLALSAREHDFRFALDFEYARAGRYWSGRGEFTFSSAEAHDFLQKGVLTTAHCASLSPAACDPGSDEFLADRATPLVVVSSASMSQAKQERLVRFLQRGGKLLLAPVIPEFDEQLQPCTVLAEFLGRPAARPARLDYLRTLVDGVQLNANGDPFACTRVPEGAEVLGRDEVTGKTLAWRLRTAGGGQAIFLGFRWTHGKRVHSELLTRLLARLGLKQKLTCSNPNVWTVLRAAGKKRMLFVLNLHSSPQEATVAVRTGAKMGRARKFRLPPMTVKWVEL